MLMSKVSVIIPCYNCEKFISKTIKSVIDQTYKDIEIIVVDDCSNDSTPEIVMDLSKNFSFIRIIRNDINRGVSYSRNVGLKNVSDESKFVYFFDADDVMLPKNIEIKVKLLNDTDEKIGAIFSPALLIDENEHIISNELVGDGKSGYILNELLLWRQMHAPSLVLFKKNVFNVVGNWNEKFSTAADQELLFRISRNFEILKVEEPLVLYRKHTNNMSKSLSLFEKEHLEVYNIAKQKGMFTSKNLERKAFTKLYLILAFSYKRELNKFVYYFMKGFRTDSVECIMLMFTRFIKKLRKML